VPYGNASSTSCEEGVEGNVAVEPHFSNPAVPLPLFADPDTTEDPSLPDRCGDLVFNNRTRVATTIYATQPGKPEENPWKYWWRRARRAADGTGVREEVRKVSVAGGTPDTAVVELPLSEQYDAIGVVLIIDSSASHQISDQPFTSLTPGPWGDVQFKFQHWAKITRPTLISVTHEDGNVTLRWNNTNNERSIDSTIIYRNAGQFKVVGPADTTYTHSSPGPGYHYYNLKHVSWPAALAPQQQLAFPNSDMSDSVGITLGTACARRADTTYARTWQQADQYLSAGCSTLGATKRYRWYGAGDVALTGWRSDTLFDFMGHAGTGSQIVILKDSTTASPYATSRDTLSFEVFSGQVTLSGETYIPDKAQYTYSSNQSAQWFERYEDGPQWYPATAVPQESMTRIWPKGDYTVDLRQKQYTGVLRSGRLRVEVCSVSGCSAPPAPPALRGPEPAPADTWDLFGAGPWLGWGAADLRQTVRFYDLWGMPDRTSPFTDAAWILGAGGRVTDAPTGWQLDWTPRAVPRDDVRAFDVAVSGTRGRPYVFSMAVDPDLGPEAADDVVRYDRDRGLVLVTDGERALGLLLRREGANALVSVQEYGVGRWAPTIPATAWAAQREPGVQLRGTPRDVQLVLSAAETTGPARWVWAVIRGTSPEAVQATADAVFGALR